MNEHDPVDANEFVYRRIHRSFIQASLLLPVHLAAFWPNQNDDTGLSVYRAAFLQPIDTLANLDPGKQNEYYVARLSVADLQRLGLTVVADPEPSGPIGHAIIPELCWQAYQSHKQRLKLILVELAKLASAALVHQPP